MENEHEKKRKNKGQSKKKKKGERKWGGGGRGFTSRKTNVENKYGTEWKVTQKIEKL